MASPSYFYATPIGAGMSNLAQAISASRTPSGSTGSGGDEGLLAARQRLIDEQINTESAQQRNYREQARVHGSQAALNEATLLGRGDVSRAFYNTRPPGVDDPLYNAPADVPSSSLLPSLSGGVSAQGGMASAIAGAMPSVAPSAAVPPLLARPPVQANPAIAVPPATPMGIDNAIVPGGGTGVTEELVRKIAMGAAMTGEKSPDILRMFGGGNLAAGPHTGDQSLSYLQGGAGDAYAGTFRGGQETIAQRAQEAAANTAQRGVADAANTAQRAEEARNRIASGERMNEARIQGANTRAAARGGRGGAASAKMTTNEENVLLGAFDSQAAADGYSLTPQQKIEMLGRTRERWRAGEDMFDAGADEAANMSVTTQAGKPGWVSDEGWGSTPQKKGYVRAPNSSVAATAPAVPLPTASPSSGASAATAPKATAGAPPPVPRNPKDRVVNTPYTAANGDVVTLLPSGLYDVKKAR